MLATSSPSVADYARRAPDTDAATMLGGDAMTLRLMSAGVKRLEARGLLLSCCQHSAIERLASFLLMLSRRNARKSQDAATLFLPMTRSDIGDYLGLTIETVSRTFTKMKAMGLIELQQCTTVRLTDGAALERLAEGGGEN